MAFENFDIRGYVLLDKTSGVQYIITRGSKNLVTFDPNNDGGYVQAQVYGPPLLTAIVQRSGDTISIATNGIFHYAPGATDPSRSVTISRDAQGRITAVYDPNSMSNGMPAVQYIYNHDTGNLIQVLKLVNSATGTYATNFYDYNNPTFPHYITSIENGNGVTVARNYYDDEGRLVEVQDANGNLTQFIHSLTNNTEVVVDRLNHINSYVYDLNGNVISQTNALNQVTTMAYDGNNNKTNQVTYLNRVAYATNSSVYNQNLNLPLSSTDPLGHVTSFTYDGFGNLRTSTDARNNTMTNNYDANGYLTNTSDALGNNTTNFYSTGMLVSSSDAIGTVTSNYYDGSQNLIGSVEFDNAGVLLSTNSFTYDLNGNRLTTTVWRHSAGSWAGATTTNIYDSQNRGDPNHQS